MPVFVSGASGQLGGNLARALIARGHHVHVSHRSDAPAGHLTELPVRHFRASLDDPDSLADAMKGCATAYHCAALISYRRRDTSILHRTNVIGTRNFLHAARLAGVERVVHVSSTSAVGYTSNPDTTLDEGAEFPRHLLRDPYMRTKWLAEGEVAAAVRGGQDVVIVNPSTIYGRGDVNRNSGAVFRAVAEGRLRAAPPGGNSVIGVSDVVEGALLAMERGRTGERYILSTERLTYLDLLNRVAIATGGPPIRRTIPRSMKIPVTAAAVLTSLLRPSSSASAHVVRFTFAFRYFTARKARERLGWQPVVTFDEALQEQVAEGYWRG